MRVTVMKSDFSKQTVLIRNLPNRDHMMDKNPKFEEFVYKEMTDCIERSLKRIVRNYGLFCAPAIFFDVLQAWSNCLNLWFRFRPMLKRAYYRAKGDNSTTLEMGVITEFLPAQLPVNFHIVKLIVLSWNLVIRFVFSIGNL